MLMFHMSGTFVEVNPDYENFDKLYPPRSAQFPAPRNSFSTRTCPISMHARPLLKNWQSLHGQKHPKNTSQNNEVGMKALAGFLYKIGNVPVNPDHNLRFLREAKQICTLKALVEISMRRPMPNASGFATISFFLLQSL